MPSLAKLIPRAGSGNSGGTSSAGWLTFHCSLGYPYKERFSFSGSYISNTGIVNKGIDEPNRVLSLVLKLLDSWAIGADIQLHSHNPRASSRPIISNRRW
ncbi:hypothetical protein ACFXTO_038003 [Malus domestica]